LEQNQITVAFHRRAPGPGDSRSLGEVVVALDDPADPEEIAIDLSLGVDDRSIWVSARTTAAGRALMVRWSKRADA
jgi:hypothetical protein